MNDQNQTQNNGQQNTSNKSSDDAGIFGDTLMFSSDNTADTTQPPSIPTQNTSTQTPPATPLQNPQNEDGVGTQNEEKMVSGGVTFGDSFQDQEDTDKNIFTANPPFKQKEDEVVKNIVEPSPNQEIKPAQAPASKPHKPLIDHKKLEPSVDTHDLEEDFSKTFNDPIQSTVSSDEGSIDIEKEKLQRLHKELKAKANSKKIVVKERLEKLRIEKESLGKELEDIKKLEATAKKLEQELENLDVVDDRIDSLEEEANEELK